MRNTECFQVEFADHYPDGGYGWVICIAASLVFFLCHGLHLAGGVIYVEILKHFKSHPTNTGIYEWVVCQMKMKF